MNVGDLVTVVVPDAPVTLTYLATVVVGSRLLVSVGTLPAQFLARIDVLMHSRTYTVESEGRVWIRGHYGNESPEAQAMLATYALVRST